MAAQHSVWIVMTALLGVYLGGAGAFLTVPVLAPAIGAELGLAASLAGFHTALVYAGTLVSAPFTGGLLPRFGGLRLCQLALVGIAAGIFLATFASPEFPLAANAALLAASAFICGMAHGPVTASGSHLLAPRTPPSRRGLIFSLKQCGVPAGSMLVAAVAPVVGVGFGWRAGAMTMAALALLLALLLQPLRAGLDADRLPPGTHPAGGAGGAVREAASALALLRQLPSLRALTFAGAAFGVAQFCFGSFFVAWQVSALGTPLAEAGLRMALAQAGGLVGRIAWGLVADRAGAVRVMAACGIGAALGTFALALAGPHWPGLLVTAVGLILGATAVGYNGVMLGEVARIAPPGRVGASTAALQTVFAFTQIIMPTAFSLLVGMTGGYAPGFALCGACAVIGVWCLRKRAA
ncbi:MFS transporter [Roseomonas xinghualingensis]|uniref:MFS transporter n=1 Tax=Roseomonas xinghualingensis TaxID=2986475 RepID=UPI0021F22A14|nr:MFS transporter [Roseomonas sp. SXEYE001]MCV4208497.1 MFS transporter [Roseomonas sp. SXEYE001]